MRVQGIKTQVGTTRKLQNLLDDPSRKVHGTFYTNTYLSQRYLSRAHGIADSIEITDEMVKLTVSNRVERVGLLEMENTLEELIRHEAGDMPGFTPESVLPEEERESNPFVPEPIGVNQQLFSVDLLLLLKDPTIKYQDFTIAGSKFTLVNIHHTLGEDYEQTVSLLFGDEDKLYLFSHFFDKDLSLRDLKILFDLIIDKNITGKAIVGVKLESLSGVTSTVFPAEELISSYLSTSGDYIFGTLAGYVRIPREKLGEYKLKLVPNEQTGSYRMDLVSYKDTISIYME